MSPEVPGSESARSRSGDAAPSIRSLLLRDLERRRDAGEDITSRKLSAVLARQYNCSRALVAGARRTVLQAGQSDAFGELQSHFGFAPRREPG